jgi:hypothetical protein
MNKIIWAEGHPNSFAFNSKAPGALGRTGGAGAAWIFSGRKAKPACELQLQSGWAI